MYQKLEFLCDFDLFAYKDHLRIITFYFWSFFLTFSSSCSFELDRTDPLPCTDSNECGCGELDIVDERDGQEYQTVWIDNDGGNDPNKPGLCWMRDNLNVGEQVFTRSEMKRDSVIQKYCYNGDCDLYGGYYGYDEAINYDPNISDVLSGQYFAKGICPNGWHLPNEEELVFLEKVSEGNANSLLRFRSNDTGFSADTGGWVEEFNSELRSNFEGEFSYYRSSAPGTTGGRTFILQITGAGLVRVVGDDSGGGGNTDGIALCIRCVKNY